MFISIADPVIVVTAEALIVPDVLLLLVSKAFRSEALTVESVKITVSEPEFVLLIPSEAKAVMMSLANPSIVVTLSALIVPVVLLSKVFRSEATTVESSKVIFSFPRPVIRFDAKAKLISEINPVRVATLVASTDTSVLLFTVFRTEASTVISVKVTASLPRPVILLDA